MLNIAFMSRYGMNGLVVDRVVNCLKYDLYDYSTNQGNKRDGFFSTLIDWEIVQ